MRFIIFYLIFLIIGWFVRNIKRTKRTPVTLVSTCHCSYGLTDRSYDGRRRRPTGYMDVGRPCRKWSQLESGSCFESHAVVCLAL